MILIPDEAITLIRKTVEDRRGWIIYYSLILYGHMLMIRNPSNYVYLGDRQIERLTGCGHSQALRFLRKLEEAGIIKMYYDGKDRAFIECLILPDEEEIKELRRRF